MTDSNPLLGTWRLVAWENRRGDGQVTYPFGQDALGYISYTPDGFMFVALMPAHRARFAVNDRFGGSPEEKVQAAESYLSYCGRYEFRGDTVLHHVELSFFPNWAGEDMLRFVQLEGDRLILSTPPMLLEGTPQVARLVWDRAGGALG